MTERNTAYIALGANLGKPRKAFARALAELRERGVEVVRESGVWRSPAWPAGSGAPDYLNAVVAVETELGAQALMAMLHEVEAAAGRVRGERNAPRELDLDLVCFGDEVLDEEDDGGLVLPHPRMGDRAFVLLPLWEVAGEGWRHPVTGDGFWEMMGRLRDVECERVMEGSRSENRTKSDLPEEPER